MIDGKKQGEFLLLGFGAKALSQINFVVFNERFADGLALGFKKGVGHASPDEHSVGNFHEVFHDFDFVTDLGATKNGNEGAHGIGDCLAEIGELLFHEQTGGGLLDETRDANNGSMSAMRGTEGIADENAVAEGGELF